MRNKAFAAIEFFSDLTVTEEDMKYKKMFKSYLERIVFSFMDLKSENEQLRFENHELRKKLIENELH
jgi:hypothetical protein